MDWTTLRASIDLAMGLQSPEIELMFLGGEPLLEWRSIQKAVDYAGRMRPPGKVIKYSISTNGLLITSGVADFLDNHRFETQLSFDGIAAAQDWRQKGTFIILDRLLDSLCDRHPELVSKRLRVCITVIPPTIPYLYESIRYLIDKGIREIAVSPSLTPFPGRDCGHLDDLEDVFSRIYRISEIHYNQAKEVPLLIFQKGTDDRFSGGSGRVLCGATSGRNLLVDVDGQIHGCALFSDSYQRFSSQILKTLVQNLKIGNLQDPALWERYSEFQKRIRQTEIFRHKEKRYSCYGRCSECEYLDRCAVCPVSIYYEPTNTDPYRVPDFICAFNKVALKYRDQFPYVTDVLGRLPCESDPSDPILKLEAWLKARQRDKP